MSQSVFKFINENLGLLFLFFGFFLAYFMRFRILRQTSSERNASYRGFESMYTPINRKIMQDQRASLEEKLEAQAPLDIVMLKEQFTYDGQVWDALEVLDLEGSWLSEDLDKAYGKALLQVDESSQEFIKKAYDCLYKLNLDRKLTSDLKPSKALDDSF